MRVLTHDQLAKRYGEGYGRGEGAEYRPWLDIKDVPSLGKSTRVKGWKTGRGHVALSNLERAAILAAQWLDRVTDIREQYPLWPLEETEAIAADLGVNHPTHPKGGHVLMTTDILLTVSDAGAPLEAVTVKPDSDLDRVRVLEKLEIERVYWERRDVRMGIVTGKELPEGFIANLGWMHEYHSITAETLSEAEIDRAGDHLFDRLHGSPNRALRDICGEADERLGHRDAGTCLAVVRHALARKFWTVPLDRQIDPGMPLPPPARDMAMAHARVAAKR